MKINKQIRFFSLMIFVLAYNSLHPDEENNESFESITPISKLVNQAVESVMQSSQSELPKQNEDLEKLALKLRKQVDSIAYDYTSAVTDFGSQSMTQVVKHTKDSLKSFLTISPKDTLECDKVGGVCGAVITLSVGYLKRNSFIVKRVFLPLSLGFVTYKLVATNQEAKQSFCNGASFLKNKIK